MSFPRCRRRRLYVASLVLAITACSTQHPTFTSDGRSGYVVTCHGYLNSFSSCLVEAGKLCGGRGYDVIRGGEDDRSMLIACKAAGAVATAH